MIVVTGGSGFIGSAMIGHLNQKGINKILCVEDWDNSDKWKNLSGLDLYDTIPKERAFEWLSTYHHSGGKIEAIIHMGAISSTTERDLKLLVENNLHFSQRLFAFCTNHQIPFIYASSAATYGNAESGYKDDHDLITALKPINPYGLSKHLFDLWVLKQERLPSFWVGLKFFNVYGPGEDHKGAMKSLVAKAVPQIQSKGSVCLFKSYKEGFADGEQLRDFVYVKDVLKVIDHFRLAAKHPNGSNKIMPGIYNVGTGLARSFADLVKATFKAMDKPCMIDWIEMPEDIRHQYQYFTQADLTRLRSQGGYKGQFFSLEDGVHDYVCSYLRTDMKKGMR